MACPVALLLPFSKMASLTEMKIPHDRLIRNMSQVDFQDIGPIAIREERNVVCLVVVISAGASRCMATM